ncbi:ADP-ribosylation factor GTPase-activating protein AGD12-like [Wolffia australiana]
MENGQEDLKYSKNRVNRRLKDLALKSENRLCADCGAVDPKWASVNIGVFLCLKCCSVHRSLGESVSKVLSMTLDKWSDDEVEFMIEVGGNSYANAIYEAFLPRNYRKPRPNSSVDERSKFIRAKYEQQEFMKPSLRILSLEPSRSYSQRSEPINDGLQALEARSSRTADNREFIGILKVKVMSGRNLVVRDLMSSDPYVVIDLGQQKVQTTVAKSNLNPNWEEEFSLRVPQFHGPLKLRVYDYDMFSADDLMGDAEVDIQPLVTAAMAFGGSEPLPDMQVGRWLKTSDNALVEDSPISIIAGKIQQDVVLKLQNVESGEIALHFEWLPLNH